ncbi:gamma-glutamylcyclotransferase family protein [Streptomyces sp. BA2]|uniref:gamma-glutamylcyclotransferase family protein n=1 Tax=Streptomyces sp. BA2 TaxID=436595 RepID=UPI0013284E23|nr:gamma-glutamylcyclotransferase family protein [Streptomyces sp. BA2]MWA10972.1 gamma-glutamylcyclotransferase [Streptomyces sp. BA2]
MTREKDRLPFFVYGTLRPGEPNHDVHLRGSVGAESPARLPGAVLYEGPGYPYLVEEPEGGPVRGELITALPSAYDRLLADLDVLEDYAPGDPRNLYERVVREVTLLDGTTARAWVYVAAPRVAARLRASGVLIGGGDWASFRAPR